MKLKFKIIIAVILVVVGMGYYLIAHRGQESTDDAQIDGHAVIISPKVGGYIKALNIQDNQMVKAGDVLMEIDPTDYIIHRDRAQANLEAVMAGLAGSSSSLETTKISAPSSLDAAKAQLSFAMANWQKAKADLKRVQDIDKAYRTQKQLDDAIANEKTTRSSLEDTEAKLRSAETAPKTVATAKAGVDQLIAQVKIAQAELAQAEKDLADTKIISPIDGKITQRGVEQGNYVMAAQQLVFVVGSELWVTANFKETQLKNMKIGQRAEIKIDAFPGKVLKGRVESIQAGTGARFSLFPAENATGNFVKIIQRVPVKIIFDAPVDANLSIGPGMSVVPTVFTQ